MVTLRVALPAALADTDTGDVIVQDASFIVGGREQVKVTEPENPPTETTLTGVLPDCPGPEIVIAEFPNEKVGDGTVSAKAGDVDDA